MQRSSTLIRNNYEELGLKLTGVGLPQPIEANVGNGRRAAVKGVARHSTRVRVALY